MTERFGSRLTAAIAASGRLCVGIDPHPHLLERWGLTDDAESARRFGLEVVDAVAGRAGMVKPQVAFFERFGSAGYRALEHVLAAARAAGVLVIADAKRGDVGTSVDAYARAWLTPGSPLEADAMTVGAYQGVGSLAGAVAFAAAHGKGLFVLAATSNPEAADLQRARIQGGPDGGMTVAAGIVADVTAIAPSTPRPEGTLADIGVVLGATVALADYGIDPAALAIHPAVPILAPGFGHQGARLGRLEELFGDAAPSVIAAASRSVLDAGPAGIRSAISAHADELAPGRTATR